MLVLSGAGETDQVLKGSVGKVYPGVDVKLANGDEGEILMKGPTMFDRSVELHHAEQQLMLGLKINGSDILTIQKQPEKYLQRMDITRRETLQGEQGNTTSYSAVHLSTVSKAMYTSRQQP